MPSFVSTSDNSVYNMSDISSDFESLRVSALRKASRLSGSINSVTLGPDTVSENETSLIEDINNQKNACNVEIRRKNPTRSSPVNTESSTRSGITFSIKKILLENEIQRREVVRQAIEKRKQHMEKFEKALQEEMALMREILASKREREEAAELARFEAEEERLAQQNEIRRRHEQQLHAQRLQERKERLEREVEEHRMLKEREELVEKMRNNFRDRCRDIDVLSKTCKDKNSVAQVLTPFTNKLGELGQQMELINEKARRGELTSADVSAAEHIARESEEVLNLSKSEITRIDTLYEQEIARREEEMKQAEARAQAEAAKIETPPNEAVPNATEESGACPDDQSLQAYLNYKLLIDKHTTAEAYQEFLQSSTTKKFRFECQKAINLPVNTISVAAGGSHMMEKYQQLRLLLDGKTSPNINQHPQGPVFCKNFLAKNIVVSI